jgi:hypothetical protein
MNEITFRQLDVLWVAIPALAAALAWQWRGRRTFVAFSTAEWIRRLRHAPSPVRRLPAVAVGGSLVLIVLALMDPVVPYSEARVRACRK